MMEQLRPAGKGVFELPQQGDMRVPGRIYSTPELLAHPGMDSALQQVANVATLPGIVDASLAMPDIHWGYGFPIGGVAAFDANEGGVVSPGGVGFDINCGVRLLRTNLEIGDVQPRQKELVDELFKRVPAGLGSKSTLALSNRELDSVLERGAQWAAEEGYLWERDVEVLEERGALDVAQPEKVSDFARKRGRKQVGSLGSGNHFLELQVVEEIFDAAAAKAFGLREGQVAVMMHTGSRGCGHQVCQDQLECVMTESKRAGIELADRQLACAPLESQVARDYIGAMSAAANYAWANRSMITHFTRQAFTSVFGTEAEALGLETVYDVAHNIAKFEQHGGREVCVHRKGATRAFAPGSDEIPAQYRDVGQPVLVPGDMGTASWVLAGADGAMQDTFGSACHGAGRAMGRKAAARKFDSKRLLKDLWQKQRVYVRARSPRIVSEEAPGAYKDVSQVVEVCHQAGLARKVARMRPLGVVKG